MASCMLIFKFVFSSVKEESPRRGEKVFVTSPWKCVKRLRRKAQRRIMKWQTNWCRSLQIPPGVHRPLMVPMWVLLRRWWRAAKDVFIGSGFSPSVLPPYSGKWYNTWGGMYCGQRKIRKFVSETVWTSDSERDWCGVRVIREESECVKLILLDTWFFLSPWSPVIANLSLTLTFN